MLELPKHDANVVVAMNHYNLFDFRVGYDIVSLLHPQNRPFLGPVLGRKQNVAISATPRG